MNEEFKPENFLPKKDRDNLDMLKKSLESKEIDEDIVPILEKFFSLPITPRESCYGHPETNKNPYLSYVDDETHNEQELSIQRLFKEKINELAAKINETIGSEAVSISLEEINHGGGPKDYTLRFEIIDKKIFQENGIKLLDTIWGEFSKYLDGDPKKVARKIVSLFNKKNPASRYIIGIDARIVILFKYCPFYFTEKFIKLFLLRGR